MRIFVGLQTAKVVNALSNVLRLVDLETKTKEKQRNYPNDEGGK